MPAGEFFLLKVLLCTPQNVLFQANTLFAPILKKTPPAVQSLQKKVYTHASYEGNHQTRAENSGFESLCIEATGKRKRSQKITSTIYTPFDDRWVLPSFRVPLGARISHKMSPQTVIGHKGRSQVTQSRFPQIISSYLVRDTPKTGK